MAAGGTSSTASTISPGTSVELVHDNKELVTPKGRSKLQKFVLLVVGGLIGAVVGVLIVLATRYGAQSVTTKRPSIDTGALKKLTLRSYLAGEYYPYGLNGTWISDHELIYRDLYGNIRTYDARHQNSSMLLPAGAGDILQAVEIHLSADRKYLLISKSLQRVFRHSAFAYYDAIEVATRRSFPIGLNSTGDFLQLAEWSTTGNGLVFVQGNNIYFKPSVTADAIAITTDGSRSVGYGTCDWVYEEEVFASKTAVWFSPDGQRLAFVRFDDTNVPVMNIPVYGEAGRPESQYVQSIGLHYPKVGAPNPLVALFVVDLSAAAAAPAGQAVVRQEQSVPAALAQEEHIISAVGWQTNDTFVSTWMNRVQNRAALQSCRGSQCKVFKTIASADGWVDLFKPLEFIEDGDQLVVVLPQRQPAGDAFRHLTLIRTTDGNETVLTAGEFEVQDVIVRWNAAAKELFYKAALPGRPETSHVWSVRTDGGANLPKSTCLTCSLPGNQTYYAADFSIPGADRFVVISNKGPGIPNITLYEWTTENNTTATESSVQLRPVAALDTNDDLRRTLSNVAMPVSSYLDVPLDNGNFTARVRLTLPADMDRSGATKYPMLVSVYAGPDTFAGADAFDVSWNNVLVSSGSMILAQINGRGSGLRGERLRNALYRHFGQYEVHDQIEVSRKLIQMLPYVDRHHVAIWGWSYGGFASALALANDREHVFQCAISVAPVTDFTLYDSIYTERFMGLATADDNAVGYAATRVFAQPELFRNRTFMLVHGTFDDNVHYQQSMLLSRQLELHDVLFRQLSYPDEGHSLGGVHKHLYHSLGEYLDECFSA